MQLKTKLATGLIFLFLVIVVLGSLGVYSIHRLSQDSEAVLRNNQNSVLYCGAMLESLENGRLDSFAQALSLQEANITEPGERALTGTLRILFEALKRGASDTAGVRQILYRISDLNQDAIHRKSLVEQATARHAIQRLGVVAAVLTVAAFIFILGFPSAIFRPVQAQSDAKNHFIATISHELKTPLSAIKMGARLLQDDRVGGLNEEQQALTVQITEDADRLLRITGELLDLTQAETGHIQLHRTVVSAIHIVEVATKAVVFQARQKNIQLVLDVHEGLHVNADAEKSSWVLINYLTNAIRFSKEEGMVTVTAQRGPGASVTFTVRDQGPGIEARYLPRVFEKYFRVPGTGDEVGSGLGLAISKEFIEAQGGSVSVWSRPGFGSAFSFELPLTLLHQGT